MWVVFEAIIALYNILNFIPWCVYLNGIFHKDAMFPCVRAQSLPWCLTICNPMDGGLPGCSVQGILQARICEWVAMPSSRGSSWSRDQTRIACVSYVVGGIFLTPEPLGKSIISLA